MGNVSLLQCVSQSSSHLAWNVTEIHNAVILLLFPMITLPTTSFTGLSSWSAARPSDVPSLFPCLRAVLSGKGTLRKLLCA